MLVDAEGSSDVGPSMAAISLSDEENLGRVGAGKPVKACR